MKVTLIAVLTLLLCGAVAGDSFNEHSMMREPYEPKVMQATMGDDMDEDKAEMMHSMMMKDESCPIKSGMGMYSYDNAAMTGPMHWGKLDKSFEKCSSGRMQSPIDFPTDVRLSGMTCGAKLTFMTGTMQFKAALNNWKFVCSTRGTCGWMSFLGKKYFVNNLHFHHPSEHRMNGVQFPLEANIEYKSVDGRAIVVAILMRFEQETAFLEQTTARPLFDNGQQPVIQTLLDVVKNRNSSALVDVSSLLDQSKGFCAYMGSMTSPPCTEGVTYLMSMHTPVVSKRQVHAIWVSTGFSFGGNSRPVQPVNNREVTCYLG